MPIDFLVYFRLVFSLVMAAYVVMYLRKGYVSFYYIEPTYLFKWYGWSWVQPWPGDGMYYHFYVMGALCGLMFVGLCYRLAAIAFALAFTQVFLLDRIQYQNHYYLIVIMCWIMAIVPANRAWSLDALLWPGLRSSTVPAWSLWLLRFQIGVPYFFGGIAKITPDWLQGQPMRMSLASKSWYPLIGEFFTQEWAVQMFVWGGLLLDLFIVPFLLWRRTRLAAYAVAFVFHILNATLFTIGVFPWFMIFATVIYFEPDWPRRLLKGLRRKPSVTARQAAATGAVQFPLPARRKVLLSLLAVHVLLQVLLPFRHFLYPGNVNWTEEGHYFSWRMKLRGKQCGIRYLYEDKAAGETFAAHLPDYLTLRQASVFPRDPRMVVQFGQHLAERLKADGVDVGAVRVVNLVSLNGRRPQHMIDPTVDLTQVELGGRYPREIIPPLTEPLRYHAWDLPVQLWERELDHLSRSPSLEPSTNLDVNSGESPAADDGAETVRAAGDVARFGSLAAARQVPIRRTGAGRPARDPFGEQQFGGQQ